MDSLPDNLHMHKIVAALDALRVFHQEKKVENPGETIDETGEKSASTKARPLFDETETNVLLSVVLQKVPITLGKRILRQKIDLPFGFRSPKTTSVCLFVKDLDNEKHGADIDKSSREFRDWLKFSKGVKSGIDQIIALRQLKREYKTYEAKRKLCSAYDLFACDDRVLPQIERNLGKSFYAAKKLPFAIRLSRNVPKQLESILNSTQATITASTTRCSIVCGRIDERVDEISNNLSAIFRHLMQNLPGGWANVRSLYVSSANSPKLQIYAAAESSNVVKLPPPKKLRSSPIEGEITTFDEDFADAVRVHADGRIDVLKGGKKIRSEKEKKMEKRKRRKLRLKKKSMRVKKGSETSSGLKKGVETSSGPKKGSEASSGLKKRSEASAGPKKGAETSSGPKKRSEASS